ncbi:glycosyltransferase family 2 protein [Pelagibius marinus]|uniref:glycosyltransferase family 2 protein n=1 Tax=Pelagibius marinus TaxID=2762760 RepID=UPI001872A69A|nr:glycosyltransferase family 2 protein [Pelagibius marinus]
MKIYIVLPIYNEVENIGPLLDAIRAVCRENELSYTVICVDDGSTDGTSEKLKDYASAEDISIISHRRNRGLGETIRDGFEAASDLAEDEDVIIRLDADGTHEPKYIPALLEAIKGGADVAIASRFPSGGGEIGLGSDRKWISRIANHAFRICFPMGGIREFTCGYRAYRAKCVKEALNLYGNRFIQLKEFGFVCTLEKLLKLRLLGAKLIEVPFVLRYDMKRGESKLVFSVTTLGYAIMVVMYHWPWGGWKRSVSKLRSR